MLTAREADPEMKRKVCSRSLPVWLLISVAESFSPLWYLCKIPKGGLDTLCSQVSFLCLKWLCSVRCVLLFFADVRRRCCTGCCTSKRCTAVFDALREGALSVSANSLRQFFSYRKCPVHGRCVQSTSRWSG